VRENGNSFLKAQRKGLLRLAALQIVILLAWFWARENARYKIRVEARPDRVVAYFDGEKVVEMPLESPLSGLIALQFADEGETPGANLPQAWDNVVVRDLATGEVLFEDDFSSGELQGWRRQAGRIEVHDGAVTAPAYAVLAAGKYDWRNYVVEADLLRGREAGIRVLQRNPSNFILFRTRPYRHRDCVLREYASGGVVRTERWYVRPRPAARLAVLLLKVLAIYARALILVLVLGLSALVVIALVSRCRTLRQAVERWEERGIWIWTRAAKTLAILAAAAALALSVTITLRLLHGIPHVQDSVAYLFQAKIFASGRLHAPMPPIPAFFGHQFVLMTDGKLYTQYPYGFPMLLALGVLLRAPWLVNPLLGAASLLLLFRLGHRLYDRATALFAVLLALGSPFFLLMNGSFMSHTAGLFYTLLSLELLLGALAVKRGRPGRRGNAMRAGAAGFVLTLLAATRPMTAPAIGLLLGWLMLAHLAARWAERGEAARSQPRGWRRAFRRLVSEGWIPFWFAAGFLLGVLLFLAYNAAQTGDPFLTTYDKYLGKRYLGTTIGFGERVRHSLSNAFNNLETMLTHLMVALFRWPPFWGLAPLAAVAIKRRGSRADRLLGFGLGAIVLAYFFYYNAPICYGPRYYFEALPFILLLTARGLRIPLEGAALVWRSGGRPGAEHAAIAGKGLHLLVMAAVVLWSLRNPAGFAEEIDGLRSQNQLQTGILDEVARQGLENALVFVENCSQPWDWVKYGSVFPQNTPDFDGSVVYARSLGRAADRALLQLYPGRRAYLATYESGLVAPYDIGDTLQPPEHVPPADERESWDRLVWLTAPCPRRERTTLVFTVTMGPIPGKAHVYVDGDYALTISLGPPLPAGWAANGYLAAFRPRKALPDGLSGVFYLTVPAERVQAGLPLVITMTPLLGRQRPYLILHEIEDTLAYERQQGTLDTLPRPGVQWIEGYAELINARRCEPKPDYRLGSQGCWFRHQE
jgi:hypothetical protein